MSEPLVSFDIWHPLPRRHIWDHYSPVVKHAIKKKWREKVATALVVFDDDCKRYQVQCDSHNGKRFQLRITQLLGKGGKEWDTDNFRAVAEKLINDALVHLGHLKDDSPRCLAPTILGEPIRDRSKSTGGVRVEIRIVAHRRPGKVFT